MSTIEHPMGMILDILVEAGVPHSKVHAVAERIREAYDEINRPRRPRPVHMPAVESAEESP